MPAEQSEKELIAAIQNAVAKLEDVREAAERLMDKEDRSSISGRSRNIQSVLDGLSARR